MFRRSAGLFGLRASAGTATICMILMPPEPTGAAAAFLGDMLHGWDWQCCAGRYPDLWSKFGGERSFFNRARKYRSHWHKAMDERECTCPLDFWRSRHQKDCADRKELARLKAELQEEKQAKSRLGMEVESQRRKVDALKVKTEKLQSKSMIAELEATRLNEEVVMLKTKVESLDKELKAEKAQHASNTEEARRARLRLYSQLQTERHQAKEDKRAKLMLWSQLQSEKDARAGLTIERDAERHSAAKAWKDASLMEANRTADLTAQLHEAQQQVQSLTASIAARAHQPWAAGYGEHLFAMLVIMIVAVVCRLAGQATHLDFDRATTADHTCLQTSVEEEVDAAEANVKNDELYGNLNSELDIGIVDECSDSETLRRVMITCPGASCDDITVSTLFNGCAVAISCCEGPSWTKNFQFRPEDGCFELQEDRVRFEQGKLLLTFRACPVPSRILQLPQDHIPEDKEAVPLLNSDDGSDATVDPADKVEDDCLDGPSSEHTTAAEPPGGDQSGGTTVEECADFWAADEEPPALGTMDAAATDYLQAPPSQPVNDLPENADSYQQISADDEDEDFEIIFHAGAEHRG